MGFINVEVVCPRNEIKFIPAHEIKHMGTILPHDGGL
jgi:hypothetical protein